MQPHVLLKDLKLDTWVPTPPEGRIDGQPSPCPGGWLAAPSGEGLSRVIHAATAARSRAALQGGDHGLLGFGSAAVTGFLHDWSPCRNNSKR